MSDHSWLLNAQFANSSPRDASDSIKNPIKLFSCVLALQIIAFLFAPQARAQTSPEECTPTGWGAPTRCVPVTIGPWSYTDNSGVLAGVPIPDAFKSPNPLVSVASAWYQNYVPNSYCAVNVGGVTGPHTPTSLYGIAYRQYYNYSIKT